MPPFYNASPQDGFHVLKDAWGQKTYIGQQSEWLAINVDDAIRATEIAAHVGRNGFQLNRDPNQQIQNIHGERFLEAAMLTRWNNVGMWEFQGGWKQLIAFQVPLFNQQDQGRWGYIDLLGVNNQGLPVVVELKRAPQANQTGQTCSTETPMKMILEGAAYAVSLRMNWMNFRPEWITRLIACQVPQEVIDMVPQQLKIVPVVAAAPASFWIEWMPITSKGRNELNPGVWQKFQQLLAGLARKDLPVKFLSISGDAAFPESLAVQPLDSVWSIRTLQF